MSRIICKSGIEGWRMRVQENYDSFEEFDRFCNTYDIHIRIGYKTLEQAWKANPIIEGSTNPEDLRRVPLMDLVVPRVDTKYGAPMGRYSNTKEERPGDKKLFVRLIRLTEGYDKGGAYWGIGESLYAEFTKDITYIRFFRGHEEPITPVKFLYNEDQKDLLAFFPTQKEGMKRKRLYGCYAHVGQHSTCSIGYAKKCRMATPEEYADLKKELEGNPYHYNLQVLSK
jgi:hypothetical protein